MVVIKSSPQQGWMPQGNTHQLWLPYRPPGALTGFEAAMKDGVPTTYLPTYRGMILSSSAAGLARKSRWAAMATSAISTT